MIISSLFPSKNMSTSCNIYHYLSKFNRQQIDDIDIFFLMSYNVSAQETICTKCLAYILGKIRILDHLSYCNVNVRPPLCVVRSQQLAFMTSSPSGPIDSKLGRKYRSDL